MVKVSPFSAQSSTQGAIMPLRLRPTDPRRSGGIPVPDRHAGTQTFAAWRSAIATHRVRPCLSLICEDELLRIKIELTAPPILAPLQDVRANLLGRVYCLFPRYPASREEPPYRASAYLDALISQERPQLGTRYAGGRLVSLRDQPGMRLDLIERRSPSCCCSAGVPC